MYNNISSPQSVLPDVFPALPGPTGAVSVKDCVEKGTGVYVALGYILVVVLACIAVFTIYMLIIGLIASFIAWLYRKRILAQIRGSFLRVTDRQFPEINRCVNEVAAALGMKEVPEVYIVEGNQLNAFAMKAAGKKIIFLMDDVVDACLRSGNPGTLTFIIAHEMAHQALGHTAQVRAYISQMLKVLSRKDEFTCDTVAGKVVNNHDTSILALTILMTGPQLLKYVNMQSVVEHAREIVVDKLSIKSERQLSHPLLYRRIGRFC